MDFLNSRMKKIISGLVGLSQIKESPELVGVLDSGFVCSHGGVFFRKFFNETIENNLSKGCFFDLSGYEFSTNNFHIEDYCEMDLFLNSICFVDLFETKWRNAFKDKKCVCFLSLQEDDEYGDISVFGFYVSRAGEEVMDIKEIENYMDAILVRVIEPLLD